MNTVLSKILEDGTTLKIVQYLLDIDGAKSLRRPNNSKETVLVLEEGRCSQTTPPQVSNFLKEEYFVKLYHMTKNKYDFEEISTLLSSNLSKSLTAKVMDLLKL